MDAEIGMNLNESRAVSMAAENGQIAIRILNHRLRQGVADGSATEKGEPVGS